MKQCSTCKQEKDESEFNRKKSNTDGLERYCKECHRKKNRKHYESNKQAYIDSARRWSREKQDWWSEYKKQFSCTVCGESRHWCIDFHHTDPSIKESEVSQMIAHNRSKDSVIEEISKCVPVCRNCHADIHYKEKLGVV
jgi:hypothetical protein